MNKFNLEDRRGLPWETEVVEILIETTVRFRHYGQGDVHEGDFEYNEEIGWKFKRYHDPAPHTGPTHTVEELRKSFYDWSKKILEKEPTNERALKIVKLY